MKSPITLVILLCLLADSLSASSFDLDESSTTIRFETIKRMILVKAKVNEIEGFFLLDTGADDLILNTRHFQGQKSVINKDRGFVDINGNVKKLKNLHVQSFIWGGLYRYNFHSQQLDLTAVEDALRVGLLGIIGYEVFRDFELTIDYDQKEIILTDLDHQGKPVVSATKQAPDYILGFKLNEHLPTLEANFGGKEPVQLGLDSGSSINLLDKKWKKQLSLASHRENKINYVGANASHKRRLYYTVDQLSIQSQLAIRYWKAAVGELEHFKSSTDIHLDGILGINFFQVGRVAINYHQKQIRVWPASQWHGVAVCEYKKRGFNKSARGG